MQVRKAIHAQPVSKIGPFTLCSDKIMYTSQIQSTIPIHRKLVEQHGGCSCYRCMSSTPATG